ncbi:MAG: hypothetical protein M3011_09710, partial [Actinomycetota bacterium]|nr:hypothetical protein [Actinomycetota bacterium]
MSRRVRRVGLVGIAALAVLAASCTSSSSSGSQGGGGGTRPEILSPKNDALITGPTMRVNLRTAGRGSQVLLDWKPISQRLSSSGFRGRSGDLAVGTGDLVPGRHVLAVTDNDPSGRNTAQVAFVVGKRDTGYLDVPGLPAGPLTTPVLVDASTMSKPEGVTVRLNGRNITGAFTTAGHLHQGRLGAHEGLVKGTNTLELTAFASDGRYDTITRKFDMSRIAPVAGAGRDVQTKVGTPLGLDGTAARPSEAGGPLAHQWTIVGAPPGSNAQLRNPTSAKPELTPDVNGTYQLEDRVNEGKPGASPRTAKDTVGLSASPADPPIGVPIDTITAEDGIMIDGKLVADPRNPKVPVKGGDWVQVVVLNQPNRTVFEARAFNLSDDPQQVRNMVNRPADEYPEGDKLTIITGAGHDVHELDKPHLDALRYAFKNLGGKIQTFGDGDDPGLAFGHWSLIGIPGSSEGQATQIGTHPLEGPRGSLHGYLQQNPRLFYTFVSPDYVPFDTSVPNHPPSRNQMDINGTIYTSEAVTNGFHVVALDQGNLRPLGPAPSFTFDTDSTSPDGAADMRFFLSEVNNPATPAIVFIQSIGSPTPPAVVSGPGTGADSPADPAWFPLADEIAKLGGTLDVVKNLGRPGHLREPYNPVGYALVGGVRLPADQAAESFRSPQLNMPSDARATGMLSRNRQGQLRAGHASPLSMCPLLTQSTGKCPPGTLDFSMLSIAYEPPEAFPAWTPSQAAAGAWIANQLTLNQSPDVRSAYWEVWDPDTWNINLLALKGLDPPYCSAPPASTPAPSTPSTSAPPTSTAPTPTAPTTTPTGPT